MIKADNLYRDDAPEGCRATLVTKSGKEIQGYLGQPTGTPLNPMSDALLQSKFIRCVSAAGLDDSEGRRLLERLTSIERAPGVRSCLWSPSASALH